MVRRILFFMIFIFIFSNAYSQEYVPNEVLVSFKDKTREIFARTGGEITCIYSGVDSWLKRYEVNSVTKLTHSRKGARNIYLIRYSATAELDGMVEELKEFQEVKSASPNYKLEFFADPNDYYYGNDWYYPGPSDTFRWTDQWYLKRIQADKAWQIEKGDSSVKVAIFDTGVDYFHPDLVSNVWVNPAEDLDGDGVVWDLDDMDSLDSSGDLDSLVDNLIGWDFSYNDNNPYPDTTYDLARHGTMLSSFFASTNNDTQLSDTSIAGISWHCKIVPFKGYVCADLIVALDVAIDLGIDIVEMATGCYGFSEEMQEAMQHAYANGVVLVAADTGSDPGLPVYPAAFPEVIAVTGVDENGAYCPDLGYHDYVDICGINGVQTGKQLIVTTLDYTGFRYGPPPFPGTRRPHTYRNQGPSTSCSSAQVSAVAALLRSMYPDSSPAFIKHEIQRGAIPVDTAPGNIGQPWQYLLGAGRINPYRSLTRWGRIRNDTTWASFAYVSADIKVDAGKTLTIAPGTTVYFAADDNDNMYDPSIVEFRIEGTLIAEGTASNPIEFKSFADEPEAGAWYGINFTSENSSGSLSHCIIHDAKYGVVSRATIEMDACEISNCSVAGIYLYDDLDSTMVVNNESVIRNCTISENIFTDASGMRIWNCPLEVTVDSCAVNMNDRGIWVSNARPTISHCEIASNREDGIWVTSYRYPAPYPYPTITQCQVILNGDSGIRCEYNKAQVSYTKVWQNSTYGVLAYGVDAYPEFDHSKITNNGVSGVRAEVNGNPVLGIASLGKGQNNSVYGQTKDVYNATSNTVYAENCWWGVAPPQKNKFYGTVDYTPYLTSDPVPYLASRRPKTPPVLALAQNYPNPFGTASGTTSIGYSIPSSGRRVILRVYDVSGRLVRTLVDGQKEGDRYVATWDGKNDRGARVAAGIYLYKLDFGSQSITKKMVIVR